MILLIIIQFQLLHYTNSINKFIYFYDGYEILLLTKTLDSHQQGENICVTNDVHFKIIINNVYLEKC